MTYQFLNVLSSSAQRGRGNAIKKSRGANKKLKLFTQWFFFFQPCLVDKIIFFKAYSCHVFFLKRFSFTSANNELQRRRELKKKIPILVASHDLICKWILNVAFTHCYQHSEWTTAKCLATEWLCEEKVSILEVIELSLFYATLVPCHKNGGKALHLIQFLFVLLYHLGRRVNMQWYHISYKFVCKFIVWNKYKIKIFY